MHVHNSRAGVRVRGVVIDTSQQSRSRWRSRRPTLTGGQRRGEAVVDRDGRRRQGSSARDLEIARVRLAWRARGGALGIDKMLAISQRVCVGQAAPGDVWSTNVVLGPCSPLIPGVLGCAVTSGLTGRYSGLACAPAGIRTCQRVTTY